MLQIDQMFHCATTAAMPKAFPVANLHNNRKQFLGPFEPSECVIKESSKNSLGVQNRVRIRAWAWEPESDVLV